MTVPEPAEVLAEMVRLARPGGWVASQEPDAEHAICYPALPAWTRLHELFQTSFGRKGADLLIGRRLVELYPGLADERELTEVDQAVRAHLADPRTVMVPYLWFTVWGRKPAG